MDILRQLVEAYEASEDSTIDEIISSVLTNNSDYGNLNKREIVELKRSFLYHTRETERLRAVEERRDNNKYLYPDADMAKVLADSSMPARVQRRPHRKYVEVFINNISVAKSLEELEGYFLEGNDAQILVNDVLYDGQTTWTVPRWAKRGDMVLFMHSKTSNQSLTRIRTEVRATLSPKSARAKRLEKAIAEQLAFHKKYGGKIYAVGRVNGKPEKLPVEEGLHSKSNIFCDVEDLFLLDNPVDISEFKSFIQVSRQSGITPVYGQPYEQLKELIESKNSTPGYFQYSYSTPYPHNRVNRDNWLELGLEYRNSFTLETQFRQCYVDYLLKELGDQRTVYMECACYKGKKATGYVDNVIRLNKRLLPVEVKLDINLESDLPGQCRKYCKLDRMVLDKKTGRTANMEEVIDDRVLVIDTYAVYMFYYNSGNIEVLFDLSDLKSKDDIQLLRNAVFNS